MGNKKTNEENKSDKKALAREAFEEELFGSVSADNTEDESNPINLPDSENTKQSGIAQKLQENFSSTIQNEIQEDLDSSDNFSEKLQPTEEKSESSKEEKDTLGQYLRKHREERGIDLKTIAISTRISFKILESIENDLPQGYPNRTYLRGFVRSFAKYVEANEDYATELMNNALEDNSPKGHATNTAEDLLNDQLESESQLSEKWESSFQNLNDLKTPKALLSSKFLLSLATVVIVLGGTGYGIHSIFKSTEKEVNERIENNEKLAQDQITKNPKVRQTPTQDQEIANTAKNENLLDTSVNTPKSEATASAKSATEESLSDSSQQEATKKEIPVNTVTTKTESFPKKQEEQEEQEESNNRIQEKDNSKKEVAKTFWEKEIDFTPLPRPLFNLSDSSDLLENENIFPSRIKASYTGNQDRQHVYIRATRDDTWLSYKKDEDEIKSFILKKGKTLLIRGKKILLFLGRFKAVDLMYNNKHLTANANGVKSLVFPESLASEYKIPLFIYDSKMGKYYTQREFNEGRNLYLEKKNQ